MFSVRLQRLFRHTLLVSALTFAAQAADAFPLSVYYDQIHSGFVDWSWAAHDLNQKAVRHNGTAAISFEPDAWKALFLHRNGNLNVADYVAVEFWIHGGPNGGQSLRIRGAQGGDPLGIGAPLAGFIPGGAVPAGQWVRVQVPLSAIGLTSGTFDGLWLQDDSGGDQAPVFVDDIELLSPPLTSVYDDQLRNTFVDWSWADHDLNQTAVVHNGRTAISFNPDNWEALFFHRDAGLIDTTDFSGVSLCVHGGSKGGQKLRFALLNVGTVVASAPLDHFLGVVPAGRWACANIPFNYFLGSVLP